MKFLHSKTATLICCILAIFTRLVHVISVSRLGADKAVQLLRGKNMLEGKGLSADGYMLANLDLPVYDFTPYWPPGYSLLTAPLMKLFNNDFSLAIIIVDVVVNLAFLFVLWKLCGRLNFPRITKNLFILIAGCFPYIFITKSLPTDTVSLVLMLTGVIIMLDIINGTKKTQKASLIAGFIFFLPVLFRYNYIPIALLFPLFIAFVGYYNKDRLLQRQGFVSLVATVFFIAFLFIFQKLYAGMATYQIPLEKGFFPATLTRWYPFIAATFMNLDLVCSQIAAYTPISFFKAFLLSEMLNWIGVGLLLIFGWQFYKRNKKSLFNTSFGSFASFSYLASFVIIGSLAWLALTNKTYVNGPQTWNFNYEDRYFAYIYVFIQILVVRHWTVYGKTNSFATILSGICLMLLLLTSFHGIYFSTKKLIAMNQGKIENRVDEDYRQLLVILDSLEKTNPGVELVTASSDNTYRHLSILSGHKCIIDAFNLNNALPVVKKPTILVTIMYDVERPRYAEFLSRDKPQLVYTYGINSFYTLNIHPTGSQ